MKARHHRYSRAAVIGAVAGVFLAAGFAPAPVMAAGWSDSAVIGAEFEANWPRPGSVGIGLSDLVETVPKMGRAGPLPMSFGRHYTLSLSALSGTAVLCGALQTTLCDNVPFHKSSTSAMGSGPVVTGFWRPSKALKLTLQIGTSGVVKFSVDVGQRPRLPPIANPPRPLVAQVPDVKPVKPDFQKGDVAELQPTVVPVPGAAGLLLAGLGALGLVGRRRRAG